MATAQVVLRDLLRTSVAPVLRDHGYTGSGQDFHRRIDGNWASINVQRDRHSTAEEVRFTVNLGTASTAVRIEDGFTPDEPARDGDCHWRIRFVTLLSSRRDTWWTVRSTMATAATGKLGRTLAGEITDRGLPILAAMARDEAILGNVLAGEPRPGLSPAQMDVVGPILRRIGPPARLDRFLEILDEPSEGDAAARTYKFIREIRRTRMGNKRVARRLRNLGAVRFEPRQRAILDLGYAQPTEQIRSAIRPALDDPDWRVRFAAAQALGLLGDGSAAPRLATMVRSDPVRTVAVYAAFALARLDGSLDPSMRAEIRSAVEDRRERAVGHDRAALTHLLWGLAAG
jgi:HEAT repeat protein